MPSKGKKPKRRTVLTRIVWIIGVIVVLLALFVGVNVWRAYQLAATFPRFWEMKAREPVPSNAFRLVALGDSATQAIGADTPMEGFVGRIATYVQGRTGRPVHIVNVSDGGATYHDIVHNQLPQVDLTTADLVIVACSNDLEEGEPPGRYQAALTSLLQFLPPKKTIISDFPILPGRDAYQDILQERTDAYHIKRADFVKIFTHEGRRLDIFSWLIPHLNSKGYAYWSLAFQPEVDTILQRVKKQPSERRGTG